MAYDFEWPYVNSDKYNADWLLSQLKNVLKEWAEMQTGWSNMQSEFNALKEYVNNYFANLDVQTEINNKLDAMYADGSLALLIEKYIPAYEINLRKYLMAGFDFTTALNTAINDCPSGGSVFIPNGSYTYNGTLSLDKPIVLRGDNVSREQVSPNDVPTITFTGTTGIITTSIGFGLENIAFRINSNNISTIINLNAPSNRYFDLNNVFLYGTPYVTGIHVGASVYGTIRNLRIDICKDGIVFDSESNNAIVLDHCWIRNYYNVAYFLKNWFYCTLRDCYADSADNSNSGAYNITSAQSMAMINCACEGTGYYGINLSNSSSCVIELFMARINMGEHDEYGGILLNGCEGIELFNCVCKDDQLNVPKTPLLTDNNCSQIMLRNCNFVIAKLFGSLIRVNGRSGYYSPGIDNPENFTISAGSIIQMHLYYHGATRYVKGAVSAPANVSSLTIGLPTGVTVDGTTYGYAGLNDVTATGNAITIVRASFANTETIVFFIPI